MPNPVKVSHLGRAMQAMQYSGLLTEADLNIIASCQAVVKTCLMNPKDPRCIMVADYMDQQGIDLKRMEELSRPRL